MTWKNIEEEFNTQSQANIETIKVNGECCFVCGFKPYGVSDFFKAKFREAMEEVVGEEPIFDPEDPEELALMKCGYNIHRQEMLEKINIFFK